MGKHKRCPCDGHDHSNSNGRKKKRLRNPKRACHCFAVSSIFRGIGRCMFVTCFPVMRCFGLDECRHRHHHHHHHRRHFHEFSWYWDWLCNIYFAGGEVWSFAAFFFLYLVSDPMRKNTNLGGKYGIRWASSINHHFVWFLCKYTCQGRSRLQKQHPVYLIRVIAHTWDLLSRSCIQWGSESCAMFSWLSCRRSRLGVLGEKNMFRNVENLGFGICQGLQESKFRQFRIAACRNFDCTSSWFFSFFFVNYWTTMIEFRLQFSYVDFSLVFEAVDDSGNNIHCMKLRNMVNTMLKQWAKQSIRGKAMENISFNFLRQIDSQTKWMLLQSISVPHTIMQRWR